MQSTQLEAVSSLIDPNLRVVNALFLQLKLVVQDVLEVQPLQPLRDESPPSHVQEARHPLASCLGLQSQSRE